jgi:hypothetical protein
MRRRLLVLGVLSGAVLLVSVSVSASINWSDAVTLSEAGENGRYPVVAVSDDGTTQTITWYRYDGANNRVQVTTTTDSGQTWSDAETLSEAGQHGYDPEVAGSADGTTQTITWSRNDGTNDYRVQVTTSADSGQTWSDVETLSEAGSSADEPQVAMSADGTTQTIVWYRSDGANDLVQVATSADSGATWSDVETLSEAGQHAYNPQVAVSDDGTTQTIVWHRYDGANYRVQTTNGDFSWLVLSVDEIGVDCTVAQSHPFTDVAVSSYAYGPVGCIYNLGVTTGISETGYGPADSVTRAQMAVVLARFYEKVTGQTCADGHPFTDVATSSYAYGPANTVTRAQMAAFLERLYNTLTG